jgi:RNA polymerase sigma factor (sigma-70 family)
VQDTVLKACQSFLRFRGKKEAEFFAWLRQILRNTLANERREHLQSAQRSIQREVRLVEAVAISRPDCGGNAFGSTVRQTQSLEQREGLELALRRLPNRYRQVLHLRTQEEMTFSQVGERLHCSPEAARKLWKRAARQLARLLGE